MLACGSNDLENANTSPIGVLLKDIFGTLATIAPEKIDFLKRRFDEHKVIIAFKGEGFHADVAKREIQVGIGALERLWVASYAYVLISDYYTKQRKAHPEQREHSLQSNPEVHEAMQLLSWATDWERHLAEPAEFPQPPPWPNGLPRLLLCSCSPIAPRTLPHHLPAFSVQTGRVVYCAGKRC
jgi:hypothetical protein